MECKLSLWNVWIDIVQAGQKEPSIDLVNKLQNVDSLSSNYFVILFDYNYV
jgi:hypothetical protein